MSFDELSELFRALQRPQALTEALLLVGCLALAGLLVWLLEWGKPESSAGRGERRSAALFGRHVVDGAMFPVLAVALALLARNLLPLLGVPAALFKLAVPVLVSLMVIRLSVRVLTMALPGSKWVKRAERSISWLAWLGSILWITGLWPVMIEQLDDVKFEVGAVHLSVGRLVEGGLTAAVVLMLALWLSSLIEARLLENESIDLSVRKIGVNLTRSVLLLIGLLMALEAAGIDLTTLSVLGGAVGVGIGFGLQRLASNYVSGFVILAERSLRIGDMVKADTFEGRITDIKTRYTLIRSLDGRESIVPNELLITQRVENSSLADRRVCVSTVVQVAYGTDIPALQPRLAQAVAAVPRVLVDPGPSVQLSQFADSGLELTVYFWIGDPENGRGGVKSDVNLALLATLNAAGIDIPFPQRVIRQP